MKVVCTVALVLCAVGTALPAVAECYWTEIAVDVWVCAHYEDGTKSCHWQDGTEDAYYCDKYGNGVVVGKPPGGGSPSPQPAPPPECSLVSISDENPDQPILAVESNDAVLEMTLVYDGYRNQSAAGGTDQFALQPVNYFSSGRTSVGVECRNVEYTYTHSLTNVDRNRGSYTASSVVHGVWTKLSMEDEPQQSHGEWNRQVTLDTLNTYYDLPTVGVRNGLYEHQFVRDALSSVGDTPNVVWKSIYVLNWFDGTEAQFESWPCAGDGITVSAFCTSLSVFTSPLSPRGRVFIMTMQVPFQSVFDVVIPHGENEIIVGPQ